uniref:Reverse transcriptase domain-containing protein n=1 Tax=Tanacetum cinerariifolium TaxID=118510 RepID=A0A6L2LXP0_TANCI|nr:reverse transcriptase domain-containing protein [Tanacetum cinerariifolium]
MSNPSTNLTPPTNPNPKGRNHRHSKQRIEEFNLDELSPPIVTMADQHTMAQLLQAPTEGYETIVVPAITADNFELKHGLPALVQNKQFFRHDKEDPHAHLFDESFSEACDRFKDLLQACPHHGFSELHQLDTFYNALNLKDKDSLNFAAGGNFLDTMPRECLAIIESKSKVRYSRNKPIVAKVSMNTSTSGISPDVAELKDMVKALLLDKKSQYQAPALVNAVKESYVTYGELADRLISYLVGVEEDVYIKVGSFHFSADFVVVDFDADPRVPLILGRYFIKTRIALIDVFEGKLTLRVSKEAITFNLDQTSIYSANYNDMTAKRIDVIDMACEEVLCFSDVIASGNPTLYYDLTVSITSLTLTPFGNSDFLFEEVDAFFAIKDDPTSPEVDQSYLNSEGDILLLEAFLNDDPSLPPPNQINYLPKVRNELKICEAKSDKSSIDEPLEVELKDLPPYLKYAFLEGDDKLPVIIAKYLSLEEKTALIMVLKSYKRAIAWKLSDIKGIDPEFCTHKILMEEDFEPAMQHQRRVNPKIYDVIKQEVLKLLDAGLIYPISDSPWVSPVHCVPKKGGFIVVENEDNELIPTRQVMGWRVCIDYRHAGFYRRFIKDFSKIARLKTRLLEKDTPFIFPKECVEVFQTLKRKLTEAPILIATDWDMPFELMCDASDFAIGAVLGQRQDKHFRPIHYASKTMTKVESNYTTKKGNVSRGVCLREISVLSHHEQEHCVYGPFRPQIFICQERFKGEIALMGSTPPRIHIQSD